MGRYRTMLAVSLGAWLGLQGGVGHADEPKLSLDQVPSAVKKTIEAEARGGVLGEIEREQEGTQLLYEAEVIKQGKKQEIYVDDKGKIVKRLVEQ